MNRGDNAKSPGGNANTATVIVTCLGSIRILSDAKEISLTTEQRELVALLVAAGPTGITGDQLLEELSWSDTPATGKQAAVMRIQRLRNRLPNGAITKGGQYAFDPDRTLVDVWRFDELVSGQSGSDLAAAIDMWGAPFHGLPSMIGRLQIEAQRLQLLYRRALELFGWTIAAGSGEDRLSALLAELSFDPFNESLTASAAAAIWRLGRQQEALALIKNCRDELLNSHGLSASQQLDEIEVAILNQDAETLATRTASGSSIAPADSISPRQMSLPPRLLVGRRVEVATMTQVIEALTSAMPTNDPESQIIVVHGEAGSGKSALVSTVLQPAEQAGITVRVGVADEVTATQPYGAFLDALPQLKTTFAELTQTTDVATGRSRFWTEAIAQLGRLAAESPTIIVLEDLHAADSQTAHLVRNLISVALPANLLVIITTRSPLPDTVWSSVYDSIDVGQVGRVNLEPLDVSALRELVAADHPNEPPIQQSDFADRLVELSQGNALVASLLSRNAPPGLNVSLLPDAITPESSLAAHLRSRVDNPALENLLSIASLIGQRFDSNVLATIARTDPDDVVAALLEAQQLGICLLTDEHTWQFDHLLTMNYFSSRIPTFRPIIFARLANQADVPRSSLVRYITGAGDELPAAKACADLLEAADELKQSLAFAEAAVALEYALSRSADTEVDKLALLTNLAECSSRSGSLAKAEQFRKSAFELAKARGDDDAMCLAALAGFPSGEFAGGEPDRLDMLAAVNIDKVTSLSRPQILRSQLRIARTCDDVVQIRSITSQIDSSKHDGDRNGWVGLELEHLIFEAESAEALPIRAQLEGLAAATEPGPLRAEILHREVLAALAEQHGDAHLLHRKATAEVRATGLPRTQWSMDVLSATLGAIDMIDSTIDLEAARRSGIRWAIPDVFDSWGVQVWIDRWLAGDYASALGLIEASRGMLADNLAWHAGEALCAAHLDEANRLHRELDYIVEQLPMYREGVWALVVGALTAEAALICGRLDAAREAKATLLPHSGRAIMLGIGAGHFGPVDRYLGLTAQTLDDEDPSPYFRKAIHQATEARCTFWAQRAIAARDKFALQHPTR